MKGTEKDLGVYVNDKLSFHQHVTQVVNKANRTLGLIKRAFTTRDKLIVKKLYTTMVRPILEYGNAPRTHQFVGDMDKLERVQRRATRLCTELRDLSYEERLRAMKLPSLYYRRDRGDMIQVFKILTGTVEFKTFSWGPWWGWEPLLCRLPVSVPRKTHTQSVR